MELTIIIGFVVVSGIIYLLTATKGPLGDLANIIYWLFKKFVILAIIIPILVAVGFALGYF